MKKYLVKIKFEASNKGEAEQIVADMLSEIDYDRENYHTVIEHSVKESKN
jgi:hypothetical protein